MRSSGNTILGLVMVLAFITLSVMAWLYIQENKITEINSLKRLAKREYYAHEYARAFKLYETLTDSLGIKESSTAANFAHAGLLSSDILAGTGYQGNIAGGKLDDADTLSVARGERSLSQYFGIVNDSDIKIASIASNQVGFIAVKKGELLADEKLDSVFAESLQYFKDALRKDPSNDSARYNYELLKKITGYPETVLAQTQALVAEKKYRQAAVFLENAMQRDRRLKTSQPFLQRIKAVVGIDTLNVRKI